MLTLILIRQLKRQSNVCMVKPYPQNMLVSQSNVVIYGVDLFTCRLNKKYRQYWDMFTFAITNKYASTYTTTCINAIENV